MTDAVKLLTEEEAEFICNNPPRVGMAYLRERGLIAPEPDPAEDSVEDLLSTYWDSDWDARDLALAALKRGMEMRPPLTREMVKRAVQQTISSIPGGGYSYNLDELHAALTKEQSK